MPRGDHAQRPAFEMWREGKSLEEITEEICQICGTLPGTVRGWVKDWERGRQSLWDLKL